MLALLDALPARGPAAARNRALIVVMWRAGLRVAEALALEPKDVDLDQGTVTVLRGKGAKRRVAAIDQGAREFLEAWLAERARLALEPGAPLFCGTRPGVVGHPVSRPYVTQMLKRYAEHAGITKRVHPHGLRHTHAAELNQAGVPITEIQHQLGHNDLRMTAHYVDHLSPHERVARINDRAWPGQPSVIPQAAAVTSQSESVPATVPVAVRIDPSEIHGAAAASARAAASTAERLLELLAANGGAATQGQLRRALGITAQSQSTLLRQLHRLHEQGRIIRGGLDGQRSVIWKLAPPPVRITPLREHVPAPKGEGMQRVLDAIESLGGRGSQAQLARLLGVTSGTVHKQCQQLEAEGQLEQGSLDKGSPGIGSQVWRIPPARARLAARGGYTMRLTVPKGQG